MSGLTTKIFWKLASIWSSVSSLLKWCTLTPHRQFSKFSYLQLQDKSSSICLPSVAALVGVCAIAVLFATRKFLFCNFDDADKYIFHASAKAKNIARLLSIDLPYSGNDTLEEVMLDQLKKENINNEIGACVFFKSFGLRIAKKSDGKISRIEVIRAIH